MSIYKGKNIESEVERLLCYHSQLPDYQNIDPLNFQKESKSIVNNIREHMEKNDMVMIGIPYKPKGIKGAPEPKTDLVVPTNKGHLRISIKKSSKNSAVGNFTTQYSFYSITDLLLEKALEEGGVSPYFVESAAPWALKLGPRVFTDKRHEKTFMKEINRPGMNNNVGIPPLQRLKLMQIWKEKENTYQYQEFIVEPQNQFRAWIKWANENDYQSLFNLMLECISGKKKFGNSDAAADFVACPDGFFTCEEYVDHHLKAKFSRGKDIGRVRKMPRVGLGAYKEELSIEENFDRIARVASAASF